MAGTGFCDICGARIEGRRSHAKHCSPACARAAYALRHLPALEATLAYLQRDIARLKTLLPGGTRRRPGRGRQDP